MSEDRGAEIVQRLGRAQQILDREPQYGERIDAVHQRTVEALIELTAAHLLLMRELHEQILYPPRQVVIENPMRVVDERAKPVRTVAALYCGGQRLYVWPWQDSAPAYGDRIECDDETYRVIRRTWDLTEGGRVELRIDLDDLPTGEEP